MLVLVCTVCTAPVLALGVSPGIVEFAVPADGSTTVEFLVYDFTGDLEISLEDIPLRVEPETVYVTASEGGSPIELTFYGDPSLSSQVFNGKIRFLGLTGGTVATGIKVRATVNHIVAGQPLPGEEEAGESFSVPLWGWIAVATAALLVALILGRVVHRRW